MNSDPPVFIGYRRHDSQGFAGRVADDLIEIFGTTRIFRDDDIPEGSDFTHVLEKTLARCSVLIAVIGPNWLEALDRDGQQRLHDPDDWVRRELEIAIDRDIWVLPVLVGNARMPASGDLPDTLVSLANIQAVTMSDRHWERDLDRLVALLARRIPALDAIRRRHASGKSKVPLADTLEQLARNIASSQTPTRAHSNGMGRRIVRFVMRIVWSGALLLLAWYLFDNHTTPQFRSHVFEFIDFSRGKLNELAGWIANIT